ncbi:hypothetical protein DFQ28_002515 [Apophysomyces sp. BC1034]|nr:hypothetical protein DFQ30_002888 [Apophysomyces sp. BC1015]KAG0179642.1 hypothetical protein DFQ29_001843 [Apophysomyces sp. BC1021]KAG0190073.1 hypothetical protein DFQ28_002515 [Apophysomyces sp. BC1034]
MAGAELKNQKRKKPPKTYENQGLSGPDYKRDRPEKIQKIAPAAVISEGEPRSYTVSVAIPSSILESAPSLELKTILAGQIARALVIFNVDEIVVYEDKPTTSKINPNLFLARIFQYLETPQYLRKALVPISPDLKSAGLLRPLDVPHHPNRNEKTKYREGVTLENASESTGTIVDVGLYRRARIEPALQPGIRVTVELPEPISAMDTKKGQKPLTAKVVSPKTPREKAGLYWGYSIRMASSFSRVITESPYKDGYDYTIGITDRDGQDLYDGAVEKMKNFEHLLLAFGGPSGGLQEAIEADEDLKIGADDAAELFDQLLNPGVKCGTRSVRLEESMMMTLSVLKPGLRSLDYVGSVAYVSFEIDLMQPTPF